MQARAIVFQVWSVGLCALSATALASPFDPSAYIEAKEMQTQDAKPKLISKSVFRIDGRRFQKLTSELGSVFLPSTGSLPELHEEFALCVPHLKLMREVIPVRENIPVEPEILKHEAKILAMIQKCKDGKVAGPTLVIENPDGSQTEVKAKGKEDKQRERGVGSEER